MRERWSTTKARNLHATGNIPQWPMLFFSQLVLPQRLQYRVESRVPIHLSRRRHRTGWWLRCRGSTDLVPRTCSGRPLQRAGKGWLGPDSCLGSILLWPRLGNGPRALNWRPRRGNPAWNRPCKIRPERPLTLRPPSLGRTHRSRICKRAGRRLGLRERGSWRPEWPRSLNGSPRWGLCARTGSGGRDPFWSWRVSLFRNRVYPLRRFTGGGVRRLPF